MAAKWYVETYAKTGTKAKEHHNFADFAATLAYIKKFKTKPSTDILRVLTPSSATDQERQELTENGAVPV